ncbi:hypothetical protein [Clostridium sp.]|uniref:hypothetical protein n=1 Tax=Clostridium sp. TaxID=1506 RepID=UPI002901C59C|nr:hypothetical protein [Clostridium sp.]MDU2108876.1 hypothetical protein [Clostridium sp.]
MKLKLNGFIGRLFSDKSIAYIIHFINIFMKGKLFGIFMVIGLYGLLNFTEGNQSKIALLYIIYSMTYIINKFSLNRLKEKGVIVWSNFNMYSSNRIAINFVKLICIMGIALNEFSRVTRVLNI